MKKALGAAVISAMVTVCGAAQPDPGTASKATYTFGTYKVDTQDVAAAIKGPIPDIEFAFKSAEGDSIIRFKYAADKPLFQGAWWAHKDALYQLDSVIGGTLINGRYDDLVIEFWEPRMTRGRGMLTGNDDAVQLDCAAAKKTAYKTLSETDMAKFKSRIKKGRFKIVPLPEPGKERLHTPCESFLGRH